MLIVLRTPTVTAPSSFQRSFTSRACSSRDYLRSWNDQEFDAHVDTLAKYLSSHQITKHRMLTLRKMDLKPSDVLILGYPKSGTSWLEYIVATLLAKGKLQYGHTAANASLDIAACYKSDHEGDRLVSFMRGMGQIDMEWPEIECGTLPGRIVKCHFDFRVSPQRGAKRIYIVRDGRDVMTSMYHFVTGKGFPGMDGSFDTAMGNMLDAKSCYGSWFLHVREWHEVSRKDPGILFVKYEDLLSDISKCVSLISEHLGCEHSKNQIDEMLPKFSFQQMKDEDRINYDALGFPNFFRTGRHGDYKSQWKHEHLARFEDLYQEHLSDMDLAYCL